MLGIDWLQFSCTREGYEATVEWFERLGEGRKWEMLFRTLGTFNQYAGGYEILPGCKAWFGGTDGRGLVQLSGGGCDLIQLVDICGLLNIMVCDDLFDMRVTRIDCCYDDVVRVVEPADVHEIAKAGDVVGYKKCRFIESTEIDSGVHGDTCYLGVRGRDGSGQFVRVYDKSVESDGYIEGVRWEVEFTGSRARAVGGLLAACYNDADAVKVVGQCIGGAVDFVHRKDGVPLRRCKRYLWWQVLIDRLGKCDISAERGELSVGRLAAWLERCVVSSLKTCREAYGEDWWDAYELRVRECSISASQRMAVTAYLEGELLSAHLDEYQSRLDSESILDNVRQPLLDEGL